MPSVEAHSDALALNLGWPNYRQLTVERWRGLQCTQQLDYVAEEVPVALSYNGIPHVVMLATPTNLEEFALGFSLTEGIIHQPAELLAVKIYQRANGIEVHCKIAGHCAADLGEKARNLTGRTGCGLCGTNSLQQAIRPLPPVNHNTTFNADDLLATLSELHQRQSLNQLTGAVHAAAWILPTQSIVTLREDIGRHNALDKLIGATLRQNNQLTAGFIVVTSRASFEMVQKTIAVGVTLLAAISAPTSLAIRLAEQAGLTLIGFARKDRYVVYSHSQRLLPSDSTLLKPDL